MASTLGQDNPFRYRGYYYDTETGFYYLNARYYNPEWGRFISADPVLDTGNAVGCNMFAYCGNDPVNKVDPAGCIAIADDLVICAGVALILILVTAMIPPAEPITWDFPDIGSRKQSISAAVKEYVQKQEKAKAQDVAITKTQTTPKQTVIYRYYAAKDENLWPRKGLDYDGLSFSTIPPKQHQLPAVWTTIESIEATGIFVTVKKGAHVSVIPRSGETLTWMTLGKNSRFSQILSNIVIELE